MLKYSITSGSPTPQRPPAATQDQEERKRETSLRRSLPHARGAGGAMGGSLVSMLRWPPDLGLPSLAALLPSPSPPALLRLQGWWQAQQWPRSELVRDVPLLLDAALWGVVTAVESVALVSMMCCFFLFCGCTL
jgi:hypothetical protein